MKTTRRLLAAFLVLLMCISLFPVSVFAEDGEEEEPFTSETEVSLAELEDAGNSPSPDFELPHEHLYIPAVTDPTCTEQGFTTWTCSCSDSYVDSYVDALGHDWVSVDYTEPTGDEPGHEAGVICSVCGEVLEGYEEIPAFEDDFEVCAESGTKSGNSCGDNITWSLDSNGKLSITGSGEMYDYNTYNNQPPWYEGDSGPHVVTSVQISSGVTHIGNNAFIYCKAMTSASIPSSVTSIGEGAFEHCSALANASIPANCTTLGGFAFYDTALTSVTIPASVTSMGRRVFCYCGQLSTVILSQGLQAIGEEAFSSCSSLTAITIPSSVKTIGQAAFAGTKLTNVTVPEGVETLGYEAFYNCKELVTVYLPSTLTSVGTYAFEECSGLKNVTIAQGPESVDDGAFYKCTALEAITIPAGVKKLGERAFQGCTSLTSITLPAELTKVGIYAFLNTTSLTNVTFGGTQAQWNAIDISSYSNGNDSLTNADIRFMAFTVSYDANGGQGAPAAQTKARGTALPLSSTRPTRDGHDFLGWATSPTATAAQYQPGASYTTEADLQLYAVWRAHTYTVSYDANGGQGAPAAQPKTHGTALILSSTRPTLDGYDFLGWATSPTSTTAQYQPGASYTAEGNATLYAVWAIKTYTISYNANGGQDAPAAQFKTYGTALTLSSIEPTRDGHDFLGWATSPTATAAQYQPGASYTTEADLQLYAVWRAHTYTVSYDANGGQGAPAAQPKTHGTALILSSTRPTLDGYDFLGWATSPTSTTAQYQPGASYTAEGNATLYAVWAIKTYTISYNANGGQDAPAAQFKTYGTALTLSSIEPTRDGHDFLGWATSATAEEAEYQPGDNYSTDADLQLYAVWKAHTYTVSYDANGGQGAPAAQTKTQGTALILSSMKPARKDHAFLGWAVSPTATAAQYQPGASYTAEGDATLYAVWEQTAVDSGTCGDGLTWVIAIDGTLTVSGTGAIPSYGPSNPAPWAYYKDIIPFIIIDDGVTAIGDYAFYGCTYLQSVTIPESVVSIGSCSFAGSINFGRTPEIPAGTQVAPDAFPDGVLPPETLTLDHSYLLLAPGESAEVRVDGLDWRWSAQLTWIWSEDGSIPDPRIPDDELPIDVTPHGQYCTVNAKDQGTAYVVAFITWNDIPLATGVCRVDVVDENGIDDAVTGVRLSESKATVELYKTDYTRIQVIPEIGQNLAPASLDNRDGTSEQPAIVSAEFAQESLNALFTLERVDDRTFEIVPTDAALSDPSSVAAKYTTAILVTVTGKGGNQEPLSTEPLTLTMKKTVPKITAKAVKLNSFFADAQQVVFTGVVPKEIIVDSTPDWLVPDVVDGKLALSFKYNDEFADSKQSAKLNLTVIPEGWDVLLPVPVSVSAAKTMPKLAFKPATLTLQSSSRDSAVTAVSVTPFNFADSDDYCLEVTDFAEGKTPFDPDLPQTWPVSMEIAPSCSRITVLPGPAMPTDGKAHTYKITVSADRSGSSAPVSAVLTVKLQASKAPALTLKTTGAIDLAVPESPLTIVPTLKNIVGNVAYNVCVTSPASDVPLFNVDDLTLTATEALKEHVSPGQQFKCTAMVTAYYSDDDGNLEEIPGCSKELAFSVKYSAKVPAVSVALKASGAIDVIRPQSVVTLKPTIKNCYTHTLSESDLRFYLGTGKAAVLIENEDGCPFEAELIGGAFAVSMKDGETIDPKTQKFSVSMVLEDGTESAKITLPVKMGSVKLTQSTKTVTLLKGDRYSRGTLVIGTTDAALSEIDWERTCNAFVSTLDKDKQPCFELRYLGCGECAVCYAGYEISPTIKAGTAKIPVFLVGNAGSKPNATVSVSVKLA